VSPRSDQPQTTSNQEPAFIVGTAGHVDHGKSQLVQALTGIDPDRLREEKARGMTIDLGFAWLTLPSGRHVSIVDVPGHERFIKNMLAGAGAIDMAMLVVAADEGPMPQTREHVAILDLLGIARGMLVIAKKDLVDDEALAVVSAEAQEALAGTTLDRSPAVACSAITRDGLDDLRRVLDEQLEHTEQKRDIGRPRLPVDRSFTIAGFGTVVTGTLIDGPLQVGQEIEIMPGGMRARVRGLQNHQQPVERALPGRRTAVNLSGVAKEDVRRGQVLALPETVRSTSAIDVRLRAIDAAPKPVRHGSMLTLHCGSSEVEARVLLLDSDELLPGEHAWAQLRLAVPVAVVRGDRFVVRTPNDTVGGGEIVDTRPQRHRRHQRETAEHLEALSSTDPMGAFLAALRRMEPATMDDVAQEVGISWSDLSSNALHGKVFTLNDSILITREGLEALFDRSREAVRLYHTEHPLRRGMPREELRHKLHIDGQALTDALVHWADESRLRIDGDAVALPEFLPALHASDQNEADAYVSSLEASPYAPPTDRRPRAELVVYLVDQGRVVDVGDGVVFARSAYDDMVARVTDLLRRERSITLAQARDMFDTSRRYAQPLLEHMDRERITRRIGDERVLRER
jgi:selenocysteine-specific elongation factor